VLKCISTNISVGIYAVKNITEAQLTELHTGGAEDCKQRSSPLRQGLFLRNNDACNRFQEMKKILPFRLRDDPDVCRFLSFLI